MYSEVITAMLQGMESILVGVEADISDGLPIFEMVGYLSSEVREAKERVRMGLKNSGYKLCPKKITLNLKPAYIRKSGTGFDLPAAIALAAAMGIVQPVRLSETLLIGEIGLDGSVHPVCGILPIVCMMKEKGIVSIVLAKENQAEAKMIQGINAVGVSSIQEAILYLNEGVFPDREQKVKLEENSFTRKSGGDTNDFKDVHGQRLIRRACEVAVSGMHHMILVGPPGAGKTMVASRIPSIMPEMSMDEILDVSKIYSICGLLPKDTILTNRPFRSPHHSITLHGMVGGGVRLRPGEVSLSHHGVLFLDEMAEFSKQTLDQLRQPLEDKTITITRATGSFIFPADFMLVGALNPCKCGYFPDLSKCNCTETSIRNYLNRISRPLLDRMDLSVPAKEVSFEELSSSIKQETSKEVRHRVSICHQLQKKRYEGASYRFNSQIPSSQIDQICKTDQESKLFLKKIYQKEELTVRSYHKLLRVARTIADMEQKEHIQLVHLMEALCYREAETKYWKRQ